MELFLLVLRNLLARPVRSLLTLLGVLVATASMVLFLSFGEGLRRALFQELSRVGPAIQVVPEGAEGFVFGALPEIPPETLKALEEAGKALGVRAVVPTLFLTRGALTPAPASSSRACRKEPSGPPLPGAQGQGRPPHPLGERGRGGGQGGGAERPRPGKRPEAHPQAGA